MDKPEYIPIPRVGTKCPYCGLSRSGIYNLIRPTKANGYKVVVASTVARLPGRSRGRRLVHYASLMNHLNGQVVPVEQLSLRKPWREFRSQPRHARRKTSVDITSHEFLPEQEVEKAGV
jgi:hypothetical protein